MSDSDSEEEAIVLAAAAILASSEREYWVHPTLENRKEESEFFRIINKLKKYPDRFYDYFHMPLGAYHELLEMLTPLIEPKPSNYREPICAEQRMAVTLRFLATGDSFATIAFSFVMAANTVGKIVEQTCKAIWTCLQPLWMPSPDEKIWRSSAEGFKALWQFPHCVGAIDGKHVRIQCPPNSGSMYFNYKGFFSMVLMAVVDAECRFITIDVGAYGSNSDGGILTASELGQGLINERIGIPKAEPIEGAEDFGPMPYCLVGDEAFPLKHYMMRPYPGSNKPDDQMIFNYRLSRARRTSENAFGILANKFRLYHRVLFIHPEKAIDVIKATCVLHNFLRGHRTQGTYDEAPDDGLSQAAGMDRIPQVAGNRPTGTAMEIRETWKEYFLSPAGEVEWQWAMIRRGLKDK